MIGATRLGGGEPRTGQEQAELGTAQEQAGLETAQEQAELGEAQEEGPPASWQEHSLARRYWAVLTGSRPRPLDPLAWTPSDEAAADPSGPKHRKLD